MTDQTDDLDDDKWTALEWAQAFYRNFAVDHGADVVVHFIQGKDIGDRCPFVPMSPYIYLALGFPTARRMFPARPGMFVIVVNDHASGYIEFHTCPIADPDAELPDTGLPPRLGTLLPTMPMLN